MRDDIADTLPASPEGPEAEIHPLFHGAPSSTEFRKLRKRLVRETRAAIETYDMIRSGDRWLVCLSGGKDSYTLLAVLHELKWRGLLPVELLACIMAVRDGIVAPTIGYEEPDPECALDVVPNEAREAKVSVALSNAFAFGGLNAVLALRKV